MDLMTTIAVQLPMCLVLGAGCVIAVVTWSKHPKVSALACIGSGGLLLLTVAFDFVWMWLTQISDLMGFEIRVVHAALRIVYSLGAAAGYAVLLFAIFLDHSRSIPRND